MSKSFNIILLCLLLIANYSIAQPTRYTLDNAHSHNDYEQKRPFWAAYQLGFSSVEADLYLQDGELMVAHDKKNIKIDRTFQKLYLEPILAQIEKNSGYPYPEKRSMQVLIDLKENGKEILKVLLQQLKPHRKAFKHIRFVVSGDMPKPEEMPDYDKIFTFDGRNNLTYSTKSFKRVTLVSASFLEFGKYWFGKDTLSSETCQKIATFVNDMHAKGKLVRLWATPNTILGYQTLEKLSVDYIGSDELEGLAMFLKE